MPVAGGAVGRIATMGSPFEDEEGTPQYADVDVPLQDLRAIRRAVLDPDEFYASA